MWIRRGLENTLILWSDDKINLNMSTGLAAPYSNNHFAAGSYIQPMPVQGKIQGCLSMVGHSEHIP
jgi:hypothetical protein